MHVIFLFSKKKASLSMISLHKLYRFLLFEKYAFLYFFKCTVYGLSGVCRYKYPHYRQSRHDNKMQLQSNARVMIRRQYKSPRSVFILPEGLSPRLQRLFSFILWIFPSRRPAVSPACRLHLPHPCCLRPGRDPGFPTSDVPSGGHSR